MTPPVLTVSLAALVAFGSAIAEHVQGDALAAQRDAYQGQLALMRLSLAKAESTCALSRANDAGAARALIHVFGGNAAVKGGL